MALWNNHGGQNSASGRTSLTEVATEHTEFTERLLKDSFYSVSSVISVAINIWLRSRHTRLSDPRRP